MIPIFITLSIRCHSREGGNPVPPQAGLQWLAPRLDSPVNPALREENDGKQTFSVLTSILKLACRGDRLVAQGGLQTRPYRLPNDESGLKRSYPPINCLNYIVENRVVKGMPAIAIYVVA